MFAAAAVTGRLAGNALARRMAGHALLVAGGLVAALGSGVAALAGSPPLALAGIALAGLGTSVCAPTLIGMAGAWAGPERRARAIATVTTVAYLGFLAGPAVVGLIASRTGLPTALAMVAVLALILAALAPLTARVAPRALRGERTQEIP